MDSAAPAEADVIVGPIVDACGTVRLGGGGDDSDVDSAGDSDGDCDDEEEVGAVGTVALFVRIGSPPLLSAGTEAAEENGEGGEGEVEGGVAGAVGEGGCVIAGGTITKYTTAPLRMVYSSRVF